MSSSQFRYQCRYFAQGACRRTDDCLYAHDRGAPLDNVCRHFLAGNCSYGSRCRYDHVKPERPMAAAHAARAENRSMAAGGTGNPSTSSSVRPNVPMFIRGPLRYEPVAPSRDITDDFDAVCGIPVTTQRNPKSAYSAVPSYSGVAAKHLPVEEEDPLLCPHHILGQCQYGDRCALPHGELCSVCDVFALHPSDQRQRGRHVKECSERAQAEMEKAFELQRKEKIMTESKEKQCGICMDVVLEKELSHDRRFGLMSHCSHIYCLPCIRSWRQSSQFENDVRRSCPQCRVKSDYIVPSNVFVEGEDKKEIVRQYRQSTAEQPCRYFLSGEGECRFGSACFFRHEMPDGTIVKGDDPATLRARRSRRHDDRAQEYWWRDLLTDDLEAGPTLAQLLGHRQFGDMFAELAAIEAEDYMEEEGDMDDFSSFDYDSEDALEEFNRAHLVQPFVSTSPSPALWHTRARFMENMTNIFLLNELPFSEEGEEETVDDGWTSNEGTNVFPLSTFMPSVDGEEGEEKAIDGFDDGDERWGAPLWQIGNFEPDQQGIPSSSKSGLRVEDLVDLCVDDSGDDLREDVHPSLPPSSTRRPLANRRRGKKKKNNKTKS